ncbi:hypothetical protein BD410DRAFT_783979 [Rickenella mellea]|uniref:RNI-like protein n=1 Tax=Rickenella mellea TaxID=50990 RepID=A0A4Y7QE67_9AGAM|nr:hypothetical protein BD410DRAFT_783979 [Rickenella mellea]
MNSLESLPPSVVDRVISNVINASPSSVVPLLSSCGSLLHAATARTVFSTLVVPDGADLFEPASPPFRRHALSALLSNPNRYGGLVRNLKITDSEIVPCVDGSPVDLSDSENSHICDTRTSRRPIDAEQLYSVFKICSNIEELTWRSPNLPPDGMCEELASYTPRLTSLIYEPSFYSSIMGSHCSSLKKWDGFSLPLLATLPITVLHLSCLSQCGSRALCNLLTRLDEYSTLEDVKFDFVWLDDSLAAELANAGRRLRTLVIGTQGTKLTDKGLSALLEGCDSLESLSLVDVEGRLSRNAWTKPAKFPTGLKRLRVEFSEARQHHSWAADHLLSIHSAPLQSLTHLSITRNVQPVKLVSGTPVYAQHVDEISASRSIPKELVSVLQQSKNLIILECDWWAWGVEDLKKVLESCSRLEVLKFCQDAPFSKLLSLTSTFVALTHLRTLQVSVTPEQAPGMPPTPTSRHPGSTPLPPTPSDSPSSKAKSVLPQLLGFDQLQSQTCVTQEAKGDSSMPPLRDVKRFARKCPSLDVIDWYGRNARGIWRISRAQAATSKLSSNVTVDYFPPFLDDATWDRISNIHDTQADALNLEPRKRRGHAWTGEKADMFAAERAEEKARAERQIIDKEKPSKLKDIGKKTLENHQLPSPTDSSSTNSPNLDYFPLTPPVSAASSIGASFDLSSLPTDADADPFLLENCSSVTHSSTNLAKQKPNRGARTRSVTSAGYDGEGRGKYTRNRSSTTSNQDINKPSSGQSLKVSSQTGGGRRKGRTGPSTQGRTPAPSGSMSKKPSNL